MLEKSFDIQPLDIGQRGGCPPGESDREEGVSGQVFQIAARERFGTKNVWYRSSFLTCLSRR